jgi:hypothetical protein
LNTRLWRMHRMHYTTYIPKIIKFQFGRGKWEWGLCITPACVLPITMTKQMLKLHHYEWEWNSIWEHIRFRSVELEKRETKTTGSMLYFYSKYKSIRPQLNPFSVSVYYCTYTVQCTVHIRNCTRQILRCWFNPSSFHSTSTFTFNIFLSYNNAILRKSCKAKSEMILDYLLIFYKLGNKARNDKRSIFVSK